MERVTKTMLRNMVGQLNKSLGRPETGWTRVGDRNVANVGHLELQVNSPGDGWTRYTLAEIVGESGGQANRSTCCNAQEMYAVLNALLRALVWREFPPFHAGEPRYRVVAGMRQRYGLHDTKTDQREREEYDEHSDALQRLDQLNTGADFKGSI